jgi:hypothetical protein
MSTTHKPIPDHDHFALHAPIGQFIKYINIRQSTIINIQQEFHLVVDRSQELQLHIRQIDTQQLLTRLLRR